MAFKISPNPASFSVRIDLGEVANDQSFTFSLFDQFGRQLQSTNWEGSGSNGIETKTILLKDNLPKGTYFYKLVGNQGVNVSGTLVIIQ